MSNIPYNSPKNNIFNPAITAEVAVPLTPKSAKMVIMALVPSSLNGTPLDELLMGFIMHNNSALMGHIIETLLNPPKQLASVDSQWRDGETIWQLVEYNPLAMRPYHICVVGDYLEPDEYYSQSDFATWLTRENIRPYNAGDSMPRPEHEQIFGND